MNKQWEVINGVKVNNKIEWTDWTWNPVGGCAHACQWEMPDGSIAECYAKTVAERVAQSAFPDGFNTHYWRPKRLNDPFQKKDAARIFMDSMSDLMGAGVPADQIETVFDVVRRVDWHTFQLLTKNAPRLRQFAIPKNVWVGVSAPPSFMYGRRMVEQQQQRYIHRAMDVLAGLDVPVKWMSFEPLSFDMAGVLRAWLYFAKPQRLPIQWAVIGAASNGRTVYQPKPEWVADLIALLDEHDVKVFFKGNLRGNPAAEVWREDFPMVSSW